jgi:hypothetical protein
MTALLKTTPSVRDILFGNPDRCIPDNIDKMVLDAMNKGIPTKKMVERIVGRDLDAIELNLVEFHDELDRAGRKTSPAMIALVAKGAIVPTGHRRRGQIAWTENEEFSRESIDEQLETEDEKKLMSVFRDPPKTRAHRRQLNKIAQGFAKDVHEAVAQYLQPGRPERNDPERWLAEFAGHLLERNFAGGVKRWDELSAEYTAKDGKKLPRAMATSAMWATADVIIEAVTAVAKDYGFDAEKTAELASIRCNGTVS